MPRPKPEIERFSVRVRFLPDQLARVDAFDAANEERSRLSRIEELIDLGLEAAAQRERRRAGRRKAPELQQEAAE